ncbi:MAG: hypothetical protein H7836_04670 [Magnetococcus sp. YQC-3]
MSKNISVDEFILAAVTEGIANAPSLFMTQLEEALRMDVQVARAGSVDALLQEMLDSELGDLTEEEEKAE